ncbi:Piso0_002040 [Millerozyma farinosa CBS 7064]|uniref:Piso0_002040 protein n=1 Tax=Pichia sorbitophila (strain ATCC MYA-4447 / BCRC 22081 / CBS 7064 / NBRC 10061 / NRRL Y-12695) TaxID=559304 RepID=G8YMD4_PICSO|nr:Piso0_002040 [Millerozyma farinosa CBS 7064]
MHHLNDIKALVSKAQIYIENLDSIIEERDRLVNVLKLAPSPNDNLDLINSLGKNVQYLEYIQNDLIEYSKDEDADANAYKILSDSLKSLQERYEESRKRLEGDTYVDVNDYKFEPKELPPITAPAKSVRFKDEVEAHEVETPVSSFKPYRDDESVNSLESQTNPQLFVSHQQALMDQDRDLDVLHESVRRQHAMGLDINSEIDDHIIILSDLERGVEISQDALRRAGGHLKSFRQKCRENGSLVTIIVLVLILIVLLVVLN